MGVKRDAPEDTCTREKMMRTKAQSPDLNTGPPIDPNWRNQILTQVRIPDGHVKLVSWNVNGLRSVLKSENELEGILMQYVNAESPDILAMLETKLSTKVVDDFYNFAPGYRIFHECHNKSGYAGVAVCIKDELLNSLKKLDRVITVSDERVIERTETYVITKGLGNEVLDTESRVITLYTKSLIIVFSYSMNASQGLKRVQERVEVWDVVMFKYLRDLEISMQVPIIWCGDLNVAVDEIDIWNSKGNRKSAGHSQQERESFSRFLETSNFTDLWRHQNKNLRQYTFWPSKTPRMRRENLGWRVDTFIVSKELLDLDCKACIRDSVPGSDHVPILMSIPDNMF